MSEQGVNASLTPPLLYIGGEGCLEGRPDRGLPRPRHESAPSPVGLSTPRSESESVSGRSGQPARHRSEAGGRPGGRTVSPRARERREVGAASAAGAAAARSAAAEERADRPVDVPPAGWRAGGRSDGLSPRAGEERGRCRGRRRRRRVAAAFRSSGLRPFGGGIFSTRVGTGRECVTNPPGAIYRGCRSVTRTTLPNTPQPRR